MCILCGGGCGLLSGRVCLVCTVTQMKIRLHQFQDKYPSCRCTLWCKLDFLLLWHDNENSLWLDKSISIKRKKRDDNTCECLPAGLYGGGLEQPCVSTWVHLWRGSQYEPLPPPGLGWPHLHPAHTAPPGTEESLADTHTQIQRVFNCQKEQWVWSSGGLWPDCLLLGVCLNTQQGNCFKQHISTIYTQTLLSLLWVLYPWTPAAFSLQVRQKTNTLNSLETLCRPSQSFFYA